LYPDLALVAMKKVKIYIFALIPNFQKWFHPSSDLFSRIKKGVYNWR
jgi:hypothetical protein